MPIEKLCVAGYRSLRSISVKLRSINVLTGPNGCGKSNLYNAVFLLSKAAASGLAHAIAGEGGMPSVLYAGPEKKRLTKKAPPRRLILSVASEDFDYELQIGLPACGPPTISPSMFSFDPEVKEESIGFRGAGARRVVLLDRGGPTANVRDAEGRMVQYPLSLDKSESILAQISEPHQYPELSRLREQMRRWRFYHAFRTDGESPLRRPRIGVLTPVLNHDGADLAAALQTIIEIGDRETLEENIDRAFLGGRVEIVSEQTRFRVRMHMPGVLRPLEATELSDGTMRFLCLAAALLSPRPPELLALNEPETSLHPDLIDPLALLMASAARRSQLWVTTHSVKLAAAVERITGEPAVRLKLSDGETVIEDRANLE
jgi:predicted ATPase